MYVTKILHALNCSSSFTMYAFVASAKRGPEADAAWGYVLSEGA